VFLFFSTGTCSAAREVLVLLAYYLVLRLECYLIIRLPILRVYFIVLLL
jgi:hypothetical protein